MMEGVVGRDCSQHCFCDCSQHCFWGVGGSVGNVVELLNILSEMLRGEWVC